MKLKDVALGLGIAALSIVIYLFSDTLFTLAKGLPSYLAISVLSFIGAVSILVPIPYTAIIFALAMKQHLDPTLVAVFGGLGSGVGEVSGWMLGRVLGRAVSESKIGRRVDALMKIVETRGRIAVPLIIFLFALTPLPDDVLFIVLGALRYSLVKALIPCIAGKMCMMYIVGLFGRTAGIVGEYAGVSPDTMTLISIVVLIIAILAMMFIDWEKVLGRRLDLITD